MRQDNVIIGYLFIAFLVYITLKGELRTYMGFFVPGKSSGAPAGGGTVQGTPVGSMLGVPGVTTLSPGATGIVTDSSGNEVMNPGPTISNSSIWSGVTKFFGF